MGASVVGSRLHKKQHVFVSLRRPHFVVHKKYITIESRPIVYLSSERCLRREKRAETRRAASRGGAGDYAGGTGIPLARAARGHYAACTRRSAGESGVAGRRGRDRSSGSVCSGHSSQRQSGAVAAGGLPASGDRPPALTPQR